MTQVIIHVDLDFFYGQVEQAANPSLISQPFAIQQKHIVVTCNYLARAAGVKKLQLLTDAKRCCPRLVIVNGEDIQRYRDASKAVFRHVRALVGDKVQRLGMDELWLDVTDHVLDHFRDIADGERNSSRVFRLTDKASFEYSAADFSGHVLGTADDDQEHDLLCIASHLAAYIRESIRSEFSFTSSGGVSTSKLLAKLVGDQHKPNDQTVLLPNHHQAYLDGVEVKKIAGVGYKILSILYENLPEMIKPEKRSVEVPFEDREDDNDDQYGSLTIEDKTDSDVDSEAQPDDLDDGEEFKLISKQKEELLSKNKRPLTVLEVRHRVNLDLLKSWFDEEQSKWLWDILHAKDDSKVVPSELYPKSIGVEDSFLHCTTIDGVRDHLIDLTTDLVHRMENDLTENGKFMRFPSILRLTPRFRGDQGKGQWWRHKRTSKSVAFPVDALSPDTLASVRVERLVDKVLLPLFCKMAEGKGDWDLSLINVGVAEFKMSAPSSGISVFLNSPAKTTTNGKRKGSDWTTVDRCPEGIDEEFWTALDEDSRRDLLANEHQLSKWISEEPDYKRTRTTDALDPDAHAKSDMLGSASEDQWPDEEEAGFLCSKCSSVIPEFAVDDHICLQ